MTQKISEIKFLWRQQFFAGEGSGAGAAAGDGSGEGQAQGESVEDTGDDGRKVLMGLGVPEAVLDRSRSKGRLPSRIQQAFRSGAGAYAGTEPTGEPAEAADGNQGGQPDAAQEDNGGLNWEEIKKNPAFNEQIQSIVQRRLKQETAASERLNALGPLLQEIAKEKGVEIDVSDMSTLDVGALQRALQRDSSFFESKAAELGVTPDVARELIDLQEFREDTLKQQEADTQRAEFEAHIAKLYQQAEEFKQIIPDFDLDREFQNERFVQLTSPMAGLSVKEAFFALHFDEMQAAGMAAATRKAQEKIANSVRANRMRPQESGGGIAPSGPPTVQPSKMTAAERADLKRQIQQAAARGEKIYPR